VCQCGFPTNRGLKTEAYITQQMQCQQPAGQLRGIACILVQCTYSHTQQVTSLADLTRQMRCDIANGVVTRGVGTAHPASLAGWLAGWPAGHSERGHAAVCQVWVGRSVCRYCRYMYAQKIKIRVCVAFVLPVELDMDMDMYMARNGYLRRRSAGAGFRC
jgi:hypothetical protein